MRLTIQKIKRKLWGQIVSRTRQTVLYPFLYKSFWNSKFSKPKEFKASSDFFFTARPNIGAGIGHQMANWIAGYWYAKQFELNFVHIPFSNASWENFLGFGIGETKLEELTNQGYKKILLPLFEEKNEQEIERTKKIIQSYKGQKIIFICEQDQFYRDQFGVIRAIQKKFYSAPSRINDQLLFDNSSYNIAMHIRRGDIVQEKEENKNLTMRFQSNDYFIKVLKQLLASRKFSKPVRIFLFSQGEPKDFQEFSQFENIQLCLQNTAMNSFLNMVFADCLITSKSSFSYKPALISRGLKVSPIPFWHSYPNLPEWILVNEKAELIHNIGSVNE